MRTAVAVIAVVLVAGAACVGADGVPANSGKGGSGGSGQGGGGGGGAAGQGGATGTGGASSSGSGGSGGGGATGAGGTTGAGGAPPSGSGGATGAGGTGGASSSGSGGTTGGLGGAGGGAGTGGNMLPWTDGFEDMAFVTRAWRAADANGTWSVITDGSKVYQAVGSGTETIAVTGYYAWTDQDVTVKVKVTAAASSSWEVDLLPRLSDLRNYYQLTLTPTSLALHARVDNSRTELVTKYKITTPIATGAWHTLRFSIKNVAAAAQITAWLDATMALTFTDPMPLASGGVGLGVTNATVEFDDLSITLPP